MKKNTYKSIDLFGNEQIHFCENKSKKRNLFSDYAAFEEKFEVKKTTDDCYTPKQVFDIILNYVSVNYNLEGKEIIRPFMPNGDFENIDYKETHVVIDNPPFSIISKIVKFYIDKKIPFFLFAPHLTLFTSDIDCTHVVVGANIVYENKATVKTSFLSNMFGDEKVIGDADLYKKLEDINKKNALSLPKYEYPKNVLTVSHVSYFVEKGISIKISKDHTKHYRGLQSQKVHGKAIFGSGFLISNEAADAKEAAKEENTIIWELSTKEIDIINSLGTKK